MNSLNKMSDLSTIRRSVDIHQQTQQYDVPVLSSLWVTVIILVALILLSLLTAHKYDWLPTMTDGELIIGSNRAPPTASTLQTDSLSLVNGPGSIQLNLTQRYAETQIIPIALLNIDQYGLVSSISSISELDGVLSGQLIIGKSGSNPANGYLTSSNLTVLNGSGEVQVSSPSITTTSSVYRSSGTVDAYGRLTALSNSSPSSYEAGSFGSPSLAFEDSATGLYADSNSTLGFSILSQSKLVLTSLLLSAAARVALSSGSASAPGLRLGSQESGLYYSSSSLGLSLNGSSFLTSNGFLTLSPPAQTTSLSTCYYWQSTGTTYTSTTYTLTGLSCEPILTSSASGTILTDILVNPTLAISGFGTVTEVSLSTSGNATVNNSTVTDAYGLKCVNTTIGSVTSAYAGYLQSSWGTGTCTRQAGVIVSANTNSGSSITNSYGLYVKLPTTGTNRVSCYVSGTSNGFGSYDTSDAASTVTMPKSAFDVRSSPINSRFTGTGLAATNVHHIIGVNTDALDNNIMSALAITTTWSSVGTDTYLSFREYRASDRNASPYGIPAGTSSDLVETLRIKGSRMFVRPGSAVSPSLSFLVSGATTTTGFYASSTGTTLGITVNGTSVATLTSASLSCSVPLAVFSSSTRGAVSFASSTSAGFFYATTGGGRIATVNSTYNVQYAATGAPDRIGNAGLNIVGDRCTAIGTLCLPQYTSGSDNVGIGADCGYTTGAVTGSNNTAIGPLALRNLAATNSDNTGVGYIAPFLQSGSMNTSTCIGYTINLTGTFSNSLIIANSLTVTIAASDTVIIGKSTTTCRIKSRVVTGIGASTSALASSAVLQVNWSGTAKGFRPNSLTTVQKNAVSSPPAGLMVYDNTLQQVSFRNASAWQTITAV